MKFMALYARVSTQNQVNGLEAQQRALEAHCKNHGTSQFKLFKDEGISGAKEHRPGLDALMKAINNDEVSTVVVYSFSRFARSTRHLLAALEQFRTKGVGFVSLSEQIDTSTTTGRFVFSILASVAELEREITRERVRNGLSNARAKGKILGRPKTGINIDLIKHLGLQSMSIREIAKLAKCSPATVCRALKDLVPKSVA